jgi:hypothetical protein
MGGDEPALLQSAPCLSCTKLMLQCLQDVVLCPGSEPCAAQRKGDVRCSVIPIALPAGAPQALCRRALALCCGRLSLHCLEPASGCRALPRSVL